MNDKIFLDRCPACYSSEIAKVMDVADHSISGEKFEVWECRNCTLRFTQNIPSRESIGRYYKSPHYISHSDAAEGPINRIYRQVRKITVRNKRNLVDKYSAKKGSLLDYGCGTGYFLAEMKRSGWVCTGVEPDQEARELGKNLHRINVIPAEDVDSLMPESLEVITLWHVLEHVHDLNEKVDKLISLLKPGGLLVIAVPDYLSLDATKYGPYWAAYDVPRHLYHFSPSSLIQLIEKKHLKLENYQPMWFDSFYVSMLSEKLKGNNGLLGMIKGMGTGLISNLRAIADKKKCSSLTYIFRKQR